MAEPIHRSKRNGQCDLLRAVGLTLLICSVILCRSAAGSHTVSMDGPDFRTSPSVGAIDPDILDSEWNHHIAGYTLICISLLVFAAYKFPKLSSLHRLWPLLFLGAALFLAVWSDKEIWPRGGLPWSWLIHHDPEARQHKLFAALLLAMGIIEYLRSCGRLPRFWKTWVFPMLAVFGASILLVHDHGGSSGLPMGWDDAEKSARIAKISGTAAGASRYADVTGNAAKSYSQAHITNEHNAMEGMHDTALPGNSSPSPTGHRGHIMTASMGHVRKQHLWFTLIGLAIALFKFVHDGSFWRRRFVPYLWPAAVCLLGISLALYTEMM